MLWKRLWAVAFGTVLLGLGVAHAQAPPAGDEVEEYFSRVAEDLKKFLASKREDRIAITISPKAGSSTAGVGFTQILGDKLSALGIRTAPNAQFTFKAEFGLSEFAELKLSGKIVDVLGKDAASLEFAGIVKDKRLILPAVGGNVAGLHKASGDLKGSASKIIDGLVKPNVDVNAAQQVKPQAGASFALEILDGTKTLPLRKENGTARLELGLNQEYQVKLINLSDHEAAVSLSVDGLNTFYFSKERNPATNRPFRYYIVPAAANGQPGERLVEGWFKPASNRGVTQSFRVVPLADSLAAKLGNTAQIGQINAVFLASWEEASKEAKAKDPKLATPQYATRRPADEPVAPPPLTKTIQVPAERTRTVIVNGREVQEKYTVMELKTVPIYSSAVGTGFGSDRIDNSVGVSRMIGQPRDSITIFYTGK